MEEDGEYGRAEWRLFHERGEPLARLASRIVPHARRVLDVGCGAGQELLPYLTATAVGVDLRRSALVTGRALFTESGLSAPPLLVAAAEALPFPAASFDVVLCRLALPYARVRRALAEMARVLRAGGAIVLQFHRAAYYVEEARHARSWRQLAYAMRVLARSVLFDVTGWQTGEVFLRIERLAAMLAELGVEVIQVDSRDRRAPVVLGVRSAARAQ